MQLVIKAEITTDSPRGSSHDQGKQKPRLQGRKVQSAHEAGSSSLQGVTQKVHTAQCGVKVESGLGETTNVSLQS